MNPVKTQYANQVPQGQAISKIPIIESALQELEDEIESTGKIAGQLSDRLSAVMRPDNVAPLKAETTQQDPPVALASRLNKSINSIRSIRALIGNVIDRTEL